MGSTWTSDDVRRLARLARLELTDQEIALFTRQLSDILAYAEIVQQADTTGVPPTVHPLDAAAAWRDDAPRTSLDRRTLLDQAPDGAADVGLFRVPKVL